VGTATPAAVETESAAAQQAADSEAARAVERLFTILRERTMANPDDVALLERLGRAFGGSIPQTSSPTEDSS
jgi:hypothetical protein